MTRLYPCGCSAVGVESIPEYCPEHACSCPPDWCFASEASPQAMCPRKRKTRSDLDICTCGDFRRDHLLGRGECRLCPAFAGGPEACSHFTFSHVDPVGIAYQERMERLLGPVKGEREEEHGEEV